MNRRRTHDSRRDLRAQDPKRADLDALAAIEADAYSDIDDNDDINRVEALLSEAMEDGFDADDEFVDSATTARLAAGE